MNANIKVVIIVISAMSACLLVIVSQEFFQTNELNNHLAVSHVDTISMLLENILPLNSNFIQNADNTSWVRVFRTIDTLQDKLENLLPFSGNKSDEIRKLKQNLDEYGIHLAQLYNPAIVIKVKKKLFHEIGLSFSRQMEEEIIKPFKREEENLHRRNMPVQPLKARFLDESYDLLSLHLKHQALLLELVSHGNLETNKHEYEVLTFDLEKKEREIQSLAKELDEAPGFAALMQSLDKKRRLIMEQERSIMEYFKSLNEIDSHLTIAGEKLFAASKDLSEKINHDITNMSRIYQLFNWVLLFCILSGLSLLGFFLARDIIRFMKHINSTQLELLESEERFRTLIEQAADAMFLSDFDGQLIEVNNRGCESLGYTREEMLSLHLDDFQDVAIDQVHKKAIRDALVPGQPVTIEGMHTRKDGTTFPVEMRMGLIVFSGKKGILGFARDITQRKEVEDALQLSEENLRITLNSIGDGVIATDIHGRITRMNRVAEQLTGWKLDDAAGLPLIRIFNIIDAETRKQLGDPVQKILQNEENIDFFHNCILISYENKEFNITQSGAPIQNERGEIFGIVLIFRDVTEKILMQERLRQAQKMDAIGQLAGGVAHDFNNMFTGIMVSADYISMHINNDSGLKEYIDLIMDTSLRAADLTQKLLAFSRKGKVFSAAFNLHESIENVISILERSIDKNISIKKDLKAANAMMSGDSTQLQNVLLNLALNARDAMPGGGLLSISTRNIQIDEVLCKTNGWKCLPGFYIEIMVSDTGIGMDRKTIDRIFEPFFTTKKEGKGTGLGLAAAYGVVNEHKGEIHVKSEPGKGTQFIINLPVILKSGVPEKKIKLINPEYGDGCILIVDDEPVIRDAITKLLEKFGYNVLTAADGVEALHVYEKEKSRINIVLLDLIMPRKGGRETFYALKEINPDIKIIISSGYTQNTNTAELLRAGACHFLKKPYKLDELTKIIKQVI